MSDKRRMYHIGFCRICGTGPLGLRECGGCGEVVVLCDECDAVWTDADFSAKPRFANEGELPCPYCECSLTDSPSRWATKARIDKIAWLQTVLDKGDLELGSGSAFARGANDNEAR